MAEPLEGEHVDVLEPGELSAPRRPVSTHRGGAPARSLVALPGMRRGLTVAAIALLSGGLVAAAVLSPSDAPAGTLAASGGTVATTTTPSTLVTPTPSTDTTVEGIVDDNADAVTATTVAPATHPTTAAHPPTSGAASTSATTAPPWQVSPLEPGTEEWGAGGYGASRTVTHNQTTLVWGIYHRDSYEDDDLQTTAEISDPGLVTRVVIDFGDGTTWEAPSYNWTCAHDDRPVPIYYQGPRHRFIAPGDYAVTVTVTTRPCDGEAVAAEGTENVTTATLTAHAHAGPRPR